MAAPTATRAVIAATAEIHFNASPSLLPIAGWNGGGRDRQVNFRWSIRRPLRAPATAETACGASRGLLQEQRDSTTACSSCFRTFSTRSRPSIPSHLRRCSVVPAWTTKTPALRGFRALFRTRTGDPLLTIQVLRREARARAGLHGHESLANRGDLILRREPRVDASGRACVPFMFPCR